MTLTIVGSAAAQTQITTGVIEGVVIDASDAVLPGVDVEVRNAETNLTRTLVTDRDEHRAPREVNGQDRKAGSDGGQETDRQQARLGAEDPDQGLRDQREAQGGHPRAAGR